MLETGDIRVDQIMPRLNEAWASIPFDDCLLRPATNYRKLKQKEFQIKGILPIIDQGEEFIAGYTDAIENRYEGSLPLVIFGDHTRRVKYIDFEFAIGADGVKLLHPVEALDPKFFYYYLCALRLDSQGYSRHYKFLKEIRVPIPPLNEQRRIIAKLEKLLSRVNAAQERLATIPRILKRFRQSILAAACSGELTVDWREQNDQIRSDIAVSVLDSHRAAWEQVQMQRFRSKGKLPRNKEWRDEYPKPDLTGTTDLPDLPQDWAWIPLGLLGRDPLNTVQTGPFGALLHKSEFTASGIPVVAVGNLTGMGFSEAGLYFISEKKAQELARFDIWSGDVLFARSGATTGKVCVAPKQAKDWRMTGHILRVRLNENLVLPQFAVYTLHGSPVVKEQVNGNLRGATRPGFNTSLLEVIQIPIAPLSEQQEIVRRVEELLKTANAIEARYLKAKAHIDKLTQSILAKAFRGELVPQDPNDEPASVLLDRVTAERNGSAVVKRRNRK